jgi:hypothetical protein
MITTSDDPALEYVKQDPSGKEYGELLESRKKLLRPQDSFPKSHWIEYAKRVELERDGYKRANEYNIQIIQDLRKRLRKEKK